MNSEKNWPGFVKKLCGYVQKIPAVAVVEGGTVKGTIRSFSSRINSPRAYESTKDLSSKVDRETPPGQFAINAAREGDS
ncbi:MAG: hypothetical protein Q9165_003540 [Trypethelium subeluteriae]